jgi:ABC-type nitrate/sulfonate/bicarbonate transport system permease component
LNCAITCLIDFCTPMLNRLRSRLIDIAPGAAFIAALLLCLEIAVNSGGVNRALLPAPSSWALVLWDLIASGEFIAPLVETLLRLVAGFSIGAMAGIGLGLLMGYWRPFHDFLEPLVELMRPIPKAALVPAMVLFLGIGDSMKITSIALVVFFPVLINTVQGVRGTDPVMIDTARTFGYGPARILWKIVFPAALPFIFAAMRVGLGLGMVLAVLSEMVAGSGGMGFLILDMQRSFRVRQMYAWLVILAVVGVALTAVLGAVERRVLHWGLTERPTGGEPTRGKD